MPNQADSRLLAHNLVASASIRRKLTAIIMGVSAAALVGSGILIVISQMALYRRSMQHEQLLQAQMIANNCLAAVSFADGKDASLVLQTLSAKSALAYASVSLANGAILAEYRREGFGEAPQSCLRMEESAFYGDWLLSQVPIELDGEMIGSAFLQSDLRDLHAFRKQILAIVITSLLVVFILSWPVSFWLLKLLTAPIERLTSVMREVSRRRDYSIRADCASRDEIGVLARAFNEMLAAVELRDEKLQEREDRTKEYLDVAGVMIVAIAPDGRVSLINPRGCEMLGLGEGDVLGKDWFAQFVPERMRADVRNEFETLLREGSKDQHHYENWICTSSGEERLVAWSNIVVRDKSGDVLSVLCSGEDITDRRQAEEREAAMQEQLARSERMESIVVLAGGVAHDLNNILGPMVMLPELIGADFPVALQGDDAVQRDIIDSLDVLKVSAQRAASVVRELLALSRRGHYERVPCDLNKLACFHGDFGVCKSLLASRPDVALRVSLSTVPLPALASEDHLCRVVDNLVRNAIEAISGQGFVSVKTYAVHLTDVLNGYTAIPAGDYGVIEVADTGCGVGADHLRRIFEPFYTRKQKTERSGSGLGLSVVHGIVDDHKGFIDVESEEGVGTTFRIYLPLAASGVVASSSEAVQEGALADGQHDGRILVVDDEPSQCFLARNCLARLGYTVGIAEDGQSAVEIFASSKEMGDAAPYDLVVLDMRMVPGFDGLDTMQAILALYPEQKILIASGHAENDRSTAALELGAKWLPKPYGMQDLARAVGSLLSAGGAGVSVKE